MMSNPTPRTTQLDTTDTIAAACEVQGVTIPGFHSSYVFDPNVRRARWLWAIALRRDGYSLQAIADAGGWRSRESARTMESDALDHRGPDRSATAKAFESDLARVIELSAKRTRKARRS